MDATEKKVALRCVPSGAAIRDACRLRLDLRITGMNDGG
jgi:hypothetical protein